MKEVKKINILREISSTILCILCATIITYIIVTFVGQRTLVYGHSMESTLSDHDNLIVDKISYRFNEPERFDIVVFPYDSENNYIKRIIGLPGEEVRIDEKGKIYINGKVLEENYGNEVIHDAGNARTPIKIGSDEYFVLGDNRNNSFDSRASEVGLIKKNNISGRAFMRIYPFKDFGFIGHK